MLKTKMKFVLRGTIVIDGMKYTVTRIIINNKVLVIQNCDDVKLIGLEEEVILTKEFDNTIGVGDVILCYNVPEPKVVTEVKHGFVKCGNEFVDLTEMVIIQKKNDLRYNINV